MKETENIIREIIEGIQDKKGKNVVVADMSGITEAASNYFIICQGNSPTQVDAIADSIWEHMFQTLHLKPFAVDGERNRQWIVMDYGDAMVHVFLPHVRKFYDLEHLWADAKLTEIPDLD